MNSVPFKPAAAVYATSVANSTKPIPLDLPSNSFKIFTLLTVPAFEKKVFKSPSVALNEIFLRQLQMLVQRLLVFHHLLILL